MQISEEYDSWAQNILQNLEAAGPDGAHAADYILTNHINIVTINNDATNMWWRLKIGIHGLHVQNTLFVSRFIANKPANDPWALMLFVHETKHLEQGFRTALSVYGEMEAWQLGFHFYKTLPDHGPLSQFVEALLKLPLCHERDVLRQAQNLINLYENEGSSFSQQVKLLLNKEKSFNDIYWIHALPLNPIFRINS